MIKVFPISYSVNNFNMTFSCTCASKKSVGFFLQNFTSNTETSSKK